MTTLSPDTRPEAERVQIELLRQAGASRKLHLLAQMNSTVRTFAIPVFLSAFIRENLRPNEEAGDQQDRQEQQAHFHRSVLPYTSDDSTPARRAEPAR